MTDADPRAALRTLLDSLGADEARRTVAALSNRTAQAELERLIAEDIAAGLLADNVPRPAIRDRLVQHLGMSWRTAYRVIDGALAAFKARPTTPTRPAAVARRPVPTTPTTTAPEKEQLTMSTPNDEVARAAIDPEFLAKIRAEKAQIESELAAIDLSTLETKVMEANAAVERQQALQADPEWRKGKTFDEQSSAIRNARGMAQQAERSYSEARFVFQQKRNRLEYLSGIGGGDEAVQAAKEAATAARLTLTSANEKVDACRAALASIVELIAAESAEADRGRKSAGRKILDAIKSGGDQSEVKVDGGERLAALHIAKEEAETELAAAESEQKAADAVWRAAARKVAVAEVAVTEAAYESAAAKCVQALRVHVLAAARAGLPHAALADLRHEAAVVVDKHMKDEVSALMAMQTSAWVRQPAKTA